MTKKDIVKKEIDKCRRCGSQHLTKWGWVYSNMKSTKRQKFKCQDCGFKVISRIKHVITPMPFKYQDQPLPKQNWTAIILAR